MKLNKLLFFISILAGTMSLSSCEYKEVMLPINQYNWIVKNATNKAIIIMEIITYQESYEVIHEKKLLPEESYYIGQTGIYKGHLINFDRRFSFSSDGYFVEVRTSDGETVLKTWKESERNNPGRQFFSEKFWTKEEWQEPKYGVHVWTFKLLPEDIE